MHRTPFAKRLMTVLTLLFASSAAFSLTACNTTEGVGEDIEAAGDAIDDAADDAND